MTDRYNTLTVALEKDVREDDAEHLMAAIKMMRGVLSVRGNIPDPSQWMALQSIRRDIYQKIYSALEEAP